MPNLTRNEIARYLITLAVCIFLAIVSTGLTTGWSDAAWTRVFLTTVALMVLARQLEKV